jgi:predicted amidophosphoribosyltransferase
MIKRWLATLGGSVLDLCYPLRCVLCGDGRVSGPAPAEGGRLPGLRPWDTSPLCGRCRDRLFAADPLAAAIAGADGLPVTAAAHTSAQLTAVVGAWKYHGVRGLARPLGSALVRAVQAAVEAGAERAILIPVPLHRRRRRQRGFNQAAMLAHAAAWRSGTVVLDGVLERRRGTAQQARIADAQRRRRNLAGAFAACRGPRAGEGPALLVDDLVTSGATVAAAGEALRAAGWRVAGAVCLGLAAAGTGLQVDSPQTDF